ncbi:MAG: GNAT family N-acetyltransferase [Protaetiibacter sp.]
MSRDFEYPDTAGYPDGMGFLDEGTAAELATGAGSAEFVTPSAEAPDDLRIVDDVATGEYRAVVGDRAVGVIRYTRADGGHTILHSTYVDPELRGAGIGTAFIVHVLDERRARGESIAVECPIIRRYLASHSDYADIIVR